MTRARCAECGAMLAIEPGSEPYKDIVPLLVHPCGACLEAAKLEGVDSYMEQLAEAKLLIDEGRD